MQTGNPPGPPLGELPDIGELSYNGVEFTCLFHSEVRGEVVQDNAKRTTKFMDWTLYVEGICSISDETDGPDADDMDNTFRFLKELLSQHAGKLTYSGKGFGDLTVNAPGGAVKDMAYGPVPKVITFKPLGQGRSAEVTWQVQFRIPEMPFLSASDVTGRIQILQFNYDASIGYDDEGYSHLTIKGTIEIAATRETVDDTRIRKFVDRLRARWLKLEVDLTKFRITDRRMDISRDKRTLEFVFRYEELPPMDLPAWCTKARGHMTVHDMKTQSGKFSGVKWSCTLDASYVVQKGRPRRDAAVAFYALLWFRMRSSANGVYTDVQRRRSRREVTGFEIDWNPFNPGIRITHSTTTTLTRKNLPGTAMLVDFKFREGLYLDSRTMTFEATWVLFSNFSTLLEATGVWRWPLALADGQPLPLWATTVQNISGWRSWLINRLDANADVIVDFGHQQPAPSRQQLQAQPFGGLGAGLTGVGGAVTGVAGGS